jgi:DNA-binding MarR family transcriptional regulator
MQPIQDPAVGGILNVLVASAALTEEYEAVFGQFGLSTSAYNILRILRGTPAGHPRGEIAERMVNRAPDMTRLIDRLARRGLVRRTRSRSDRRVSLTRITPKGIALLERVEPANTALRGRLAARLSAAEWRQLSGLCERVYGDGG